MMNIEFYELNSINEDLLKYAVIVTRFNNQWIFVRHNDRQTWEIPGGSREPDEEIIKTMKRELFEETGALEYEALPVCVYSVESEFEKSYGLLCYCEVNTFGERPDYEIAETKAFNELPSELTYPDIQPKLFREIEKIYQVFLQGGCYET